MKPKRLSTKHHREIARRVRDSQWKFMERTEKFGTIWVCWWNKNGYHKPSPAAQYPDGSGYRADMLICGLIDGCKLAEWLNSHSDWWVIGEWSNERYAAPISITAAGRAALENRGLYDMEPVTGGLVEPGWTTIPNPRGSTP